MGWKGTLRAVNSSLRAMERDAQRRRRAFARQEAADAKIAMLRESANEVMEFEAFIDYLTSIHKVRPEPIVWVARAKVPEPVRPPPSTTNQTRAEEKLASYQPGLFGRLFGREAQQREKLAQAISAARKRDLA